MNSFQCVCGNKLFFENTQCVSCGREVGWCPVCRGIRAVAPIGDDRFQCLAPECGATLAKCTNYAVEAVCNRFTAVDPETDHHPALCDCCRFNDTVPDLSVEGNRERWQRIEAAKRRLIYMLDVLGLPYGGEGDPVAVPLSFDFKGDELPQTGRWRAAAEAETVFTGHANGKITINIREADDAEREALRVDMGEAHRTLIGHFRHEIAHYYWELLIRSRAEPAFSGVFGDPDQPPYGDALERHYRDGAPANWPLAHISAYATMHPWEDWAETFAFYLDMASVLETTANVGLIPAVDHDDFDRMMAVFGQVGMVANELNRTMGLIDLVPETIVAPVEHKLRFVHDVVVGARTGRPVP